MSGRDLALAGIPRGGTTLACRLLGQARDTVSLFEPMAVQHLPAGDPVAGTRAVCEFLAGTREQILRDGTAPSKHAGGAIPDNPFGPAEAGGGARKLQVRLGTITVDPPPRPGFTLVVKHNAAFLALLPDLAQAVETLAIVRNPLAVLASWQTVDLPVRRGRLPAGERLDARFAASLDAEPDELQRQLLVLDWCFARIATLPPQRVLRYENVVGTGGASLYAAAGVEGRPDGTLKTRNATPAAPGIATGRLARALVARAGAWERWYTADEIASLAHELGT